MPIVYTWPAGYPGLFGYTYDRESGGFTIYHLRQALTLIPSMPEVEKIHLIAHNRGTDVAVAAVRELTIAARAAGINPRKKFKIHNLVLAAPDLDVQVAQQRIAGEKLAYSAHRFTIYTSPADQAIGIASKLFASPRGRIGTLGLENVPDDQTQQPTGKRSCQTNSTSSSWIRTEPSASFSGNGSDAHRRSGAYR